MWREEGVRLGAILSRWETQRTGRSRVPQEAFLHGSGRDGGGGWDREGGRQMDYKVRGTLTFGLQDAEKASFRWDTTGGQPHK